MEKRELQIQIGLEIQKARLKCGITQTELADRIGSRQPRLAAIERGKSLPSFDYLLRIAEELGANFNAPFFDFWSSATNTIKFHTP